MDSIIDRFFRPLVMQKAFHNESTKFTLAVPGPAGAVWSIDVTQGDVADQAIRLAQESYSPYVQVDSSSSILGKRKVVAPVTTDDH